MKYRFSKGKIVSPQGFVKVYPTVIIKDSLKYGWVFNSEINHIDLEYAEEIVEKIEEVRKW